MKKEDVAFLGCRLLAIFWALNAIELLSQALPIWYEWFNNPVPPPQQLTTLLANLLHLTLIAVPTLFLWFRADLAVGLLLPQESDESDDERAAEAITLHQAQTLAFATVGLFVLVSAIPQISFAFYPPFWVSRMLAVLIKCALGLTLLLKANRVSDALNRFRGIDQSPLPVQEN